MVHRLWVREYAKCVYSRTERNLKMSQKIISLDWSTSLTILYEFAYFTSVNFLHIFFPFKCVLETKCSFSGSFLNSLLLSNTNKWQILFFRNYIIRYISWFFDKDRIYIYLNAAKLSILNQIFWSDMCFKKIMVVLKKYSFTNQILINWKINENTSRLIYLQKSHYQVQRFCF